MKIRIGNVSLLALVLLGVGAACASFEIEAKGLLYDAGGEVRVSVGADKVKAEKLPDTNRMDVEFFDADGNPLPPGATGVGEGDAVPVPANAAYVTLTGPSEATACTGCDAPPSGGGGGGGSGGDMFDPAQSGNTQQPSQGQMSARTSSRRVYVFTINPDDTQTSAWGNVQAQFSVSAYSSHAALQRVRYVLENGAGCVLPMGVVVETYARLVAEDEGGRFFIADVTTDFTTVRVDWNANVTSAPVDLQEYDLSHGWRTVDVFLPYRSWDLAAQGHNRLQVDWMTVEDSAFRGLLTEVQRL